jgi:hypothetical protein
MIGTFLCATYQSADFAPDASTETYSLRPRGVGNLFTGEVYVIPRSTEDVTKRHAELQTLAHDVDWRFHDLALVFMERL